MRILIILLLVAYSALTWAADIDALNKAGLSYRYNSETKELIGYVLKGSIGFKIENYAPLIVALEVAKPGQVVKIFIEDNNGGATYTADRISLAMRNSKGIVKVYTRGKVLSAAADIAVQATTIEIAAGTIFLWHLGSAPSPAGYIRVNPDMLGWAIPFYSNHYIYRIKVESALHSPAKLYFMGRYIDNPFTRTFVSKATMEYINSGQDKYVPGWKVCENRGGYWAALRMDATGVCTIKGTKQ